MYIVEILTSSKNWEKALDYIENSEGLTNGTTEIKATITYYYGKVLRALGRKKEARKNFYVIFL